MSGTTKAMTHSNNVNRMIFKEEHDDNVFPSPVTEISSAVLPCGTLRDIGKFSLADVTTSVPIGRIKLSNPICRIVSLLKENMSQKQLSELCFLPSDILPPPHHLYNTIHERKNLATHLTKHSSFHNLTLLHQPKSRIGRESQRYAISPVTNLPTTRLTVGSVPILRNGMILMVSSARKANWILPKGGWEKDESSEDGALRETYEEGGILGTLGVKLEEVEYVKQDGGGTELVYNRCVQTSLTGNDRCKFRSGERDLFLKDGTSAQTTFNERRRCMLMYPLYVEEVRKTWPESGRARKAVDIDTAIEISAAYPEFQTVLREVKRKGYHLHHPSS